MRSGVGGSSRPGERVRGAAASAVPEVGAAAAAVQVGESPSSNTGAEMSCGTVGVGWLGVTSWCPDRSAALLELGDLFGDLRERSRPTRWYTRAWDVLATSTVSVTDERPEEVHVELTQSDCEVLGMVAIRAVLLWAESGGKRRKVSRLDLNQDDPSKTVTPRQVYDAITAGNTVTHVSPKGLTHWEGRDGGETTYIGAPSSRERARVYAADVVHGEGHGTRWEWQGRDERAEYVADQVFGLRCMPAVDAGGVQRVFWGAVGRLCSFVDRSSAERPEDCVPLGWWSVLTGGVAKLRLPKVQVVPVMFGRSARYVRDQVAPTLAYLVSEVDRSGHGGFAWLRRLIEVDGAARMNRRMVYALRA